MARAEVDRTGDDGTSRPGPPEPGMSLGAVGGEGYGPYPPDPDPNDPFSVDGAKARHEGTLDNSKLAKPRTLCLAKRVFYPRKAAINPVLDNQTQDSCSHVRLSYSLTAQMVFKAQGMTYFMTFLVHFPP